MQRIVTAGASLLFAAVLNAQNAPVYNNIPSPLPPSLTSESFQADRISEFGNLVQFGATRRNLNFVNVSMVTWAYFSKYNPPNAANTGGWSWPITLNLYAVNTTNPNVPGNLVGTVTQTVLIPWRPEPSPMCPGTTEWYATDGCHNGLAFNVTFDLRSLSLNLPTQAIFGIAYNTQSAGQSPTGMVGPYDDLNVGLNPSGPTVGNNLSAPTAYVNGALDTNNTHTSIAIEFDVPATAAIYNSTPAPFMASLTNQSFQAQRISEFGDRIQFGGTGSLTSVTVSMVTLAYFSKYNTGAPTAGGWTWPITLNLYSVDTSNPNNPGSLIGTATKTFFIPWRPEPTPSCGGTLWLASDNVCHNGMAVDITFDIGSFSMPPPNPLPSQLIFGIAYNTQSAGQIPTGTNGPYNDLNVGLYAPNPTVGSNLSAPTAYLNGTIGQSYADGGAGGVGVFRLDVGGTHTNIAIQFDVPSPPPASIVVTGGQGQSTTVGTQFGSTLQAQVKDTSGNPSAGVTVTFSAPGSGASATLLNPSAITDANGLASVFATANTTAGVYAVTASAAGVATPATFNLTNLAGPPQTIKFEVPPANTQAGQAISPAVAVSLKDAYNNPIAGMTITLSIPGGTPVTGTAATTDSNGIASFPGLVIQKAGTYQLEASGGGLTTLSTNFTVTAGSAVSIVVVSGNNQTAAVGTTYASPLKALVQDAFQNPIPGASTTFGAPASGASVSFGSSATVTTDVNGVATAPAMTANAQAGSVQVTASTPGAGSSTPTVAFNLTNVAGTANKLTFVQQPTNTAAGAGITPAVTVQLADSFGNAAHTPGISVTLQLIPVTVSGRVRTVPPFASQNTDASGLATFAGLTINQVGTYQLLASAAAVSSATSTDFNVHAGTAANIQATGGTPQSATILTSFTQPLQATVTDSFGNPISGAMVTFTAPGAGASATLSAPSSSTDALGHAAVSATADGIAGSYTVTASTAGISANAGFALTNVTGGVGQITFVQQPTNTTAGATIAPPVVVHEVDSGGNPVGGATVTLTLQPNTATLNGTLSIMTDASGNATFGDLSINTSGSYVLIASTGTISTVSSAFTIGPTTASVTISVYDGSGQSAPVGGSYTAPLRALVQDLYGNVLAGAAVTFSAPTSGASVTFNGSATVNTDAQGIATSPNMSANSQTGAFQVTASTSGAMAPATFTLTNVVGTANRLAYVQQPADTAAGATIAPPVTVQLQDTSGNAVHTAGVPIAIQSNAVLQRRHLFSGNATQNTDANGVATFATLSIAQVGTYQLTASSSGIASATSNPFHITAGPASIIQSSGGTPQSTIINTAFGAPLQVLVTDSLGNPISGVQVTFTAPTSGASGLFAGQSIVNVTTDAQGHASAVITANGTPGTYGVIASASAITGSAQFILTNLPGGASMLVFIQQPTDTVAGKTIAPSITVQVQDGSGHAIGSAGVPVLITLFAGTGSLLGTIVQPTDSTGTATFNDLSIGQVGAKQLRAVSTGQAPATSTGFQITAGAPTNISVYSGSPQSTTVSQPFLSALEAQVTDVAGNPVGGVTVTFAIPNPSGAGGTFSGPATVQTGADGIAISPILAANSQPGNFVATATAAGVSAPTVFALTNVPSQSPSVVVNPTALTFASEFNQPAPSGQTVQISTNGTITWSVSSSASWLAATPANGAGSGQITVSVTPAGLAAGTYTGSILITDSAGGVSVVMATYAITNKPALVVTPSALVFTTANNTIAPSAQTLQATSNSRTIAYRVVAQVSTPSGGTWLQVSPSQGQTVGTVTVTANPAGLTQGIYSGSVLFTPTDSTLNSVAVPVTFIVGCQQGGCVLQPNIIAVVNAASFHPGGAPGAIMTIFGANLSDGVYEAPSYPLPTTLGPTSVTANGTPVPLYYASPTQINFEMPSNAPAAGVTVVVNNSAATGRYSSKGSSPHISTLTTVDPGLFISPDGRAAALNGDLTPNTAAMPAPAGGYVILYFTGQGPVAPPVADGAPAPASPLSIISSPVQVTIGGKSAQVTYQGLAPGFAGLAQVNVIVPSGLTPGDQTVFMTINGLPSNAGLITVK